MKFATIPRFLFGLIVIGFGCAASAQSAAPFRLELKPSQATVGDAVQVSLHPLERAGAAPVITSVRFEDDAEHWEVTEPWTRDFRPQPNGQPGLWHATLKPFARGEALPLPSTLVTYQTDGVTTTTALTSATLRVMSTIDPNDPDLRLSGLRGVAPVPSDRLWIAWLAGGALLAALILVLLRRLRRDRPPVEVPDEPGLPPGLWALRELDRSSRLPVCQTGPARGIYSLVSDVIRRYLNRRYGIDTLDMTSRECLLALAGPVRDARTLEWLEQFFNECDLAKFSHFEPPRERWPAIWGDARMIVCMTTPAGELETSDPASAPAAANGEALA